MTTDQPESGEKKVDESWKAKVEQDKTGQKVDPPQGVSARSAQRLPTADLQFFLSSLSMQTLVALGELPHPATGRQEEDLEQARYLIDVLGMLQQKTKGNLSGEESALLESLLYELRMKYVSKEKP